jgi:hypothetical protein
MLFWGFCPRRRSLCSEVRPVPSILSLWVESYAGFLESCRWLLVACFAAGVGLYFALVDSRMVALKFHFARRGPAEDRALRESALFARCGLVAGG